MSKSKLKLEDVEVESFEAGEIASAGGTVKANEMLRTAVGGTCPGQTGACTACPPVHCY